MLDIINTISPFVEDCYKELSVREFSRSVGVSPPTGSRMLKNYEKEGLVKSRAFKNNLLFRANRESKVLKKLSEIYWLQKLEGVVEKLSEALRPESIILFGSLCKLEAKEDSDIDLAIIGGVGKKEEIHKLEKMLGREIQLHRFSSIRK